MTSLEVIVFGPETAPIALPARSSTSESIVTVTSTGVRTRSLVTTRTTLPAPVTVALTTVPAGLKV